MDSRGRVWLFLDPFLSSKGCRKVGTCLPEAKTINLLYHEELLRALSSQLCFSETSPATDHTFSQITLVFRQHLKSTRIFKFRPRLVGLKDFFYSFFKNYHPQSFHYLVFQEPHLSILLLANRYANGVRIIRRWTLIRRWTMMNPFHSSHMIYLDRHHQFLIWK